MNKKYYKVADNCFCVEADQQILDKMKDYEPFLADESFASSCLFTVTIRQASFFDETYTKDTFSQIVNLDVTNGHTSDGKDIFEYKWEGKDLFWLVCENDYHKGTLTVTGIQLKMALDMAITIIYRYSALKTMTSVIHASAVSYQGKAYLFLGNSGTGKSTHSRLWLQHFEGTELINDDKPIIRILDNGIVRVYGSPWSGKTPCYRNVDYPLGGLVKLSQAPYNKIRRLSKVEAYFILLQSIFGKRWNKDISDGLHLFKERLISLVPVWHLECLPDEDAARLCRDTITKNQ